MSSNHIISFALNTLTTSLLCYIIQFVGGFGKPQNLNDIDHEHDENNITQTLLNKISNLEKNILHLQQTIDDLEERFNANHSQITSNTEIVNKIDKFINYNYDILD